MSNNESSSMNNNIFIYRYYYLILSLFGGFLSYILYILKLKTSIYDNVFSFIFNCIDFFVYIPLVIIYLIYFYKINILSKKLKEEIYLIILYSIFVSFFIFLHKSYTFSNVIDLFIYILFTNAIVIFILKTILFKIEKKSG
jgi:hypothetical protein